MKEQPFKKYKKKKSQLLTQLLHFNVLSHNLNTPLYLTFSFHYRDFIVIYKFITTGPFAGCPNANVYYEACVYDLCASLPDTSIMCENIETFAQDCINSGVDIGTWRSESLCCKFVLCILNDL